MEFGFQHAVAANKTKSLAQASISVYTVSIELSAFDADIQRRLQGSKASNRFSVDSLGQSSPVLALIYSKAPSINLPNLVPFCNLSKRYLLRQHISCSAAELLLYIG